MLAACSLLMVGMGGNLGCNLNQEGVSPPDNRIFFPGGAVMEDDGRFLYVVSSNSDLRYNAGTLVAVDLAAVRNDDPREPLATSYDAANPRGLWPACSSDSRYVPPPDVAPENRCCWDYLDSNILNCDEQASIRRESSVRIGNFGGRPVMQQLPGSGPGDSFGSGRRRLFVPVRGDSSIVMVDVEAHPEGEGSVRFSCTGPRPGPAVDQKPFATCERTWQITRAQDPLNMANAPAIPDDQVLRLPEEPYALTVDEQARLLYVGHLRGGSLSLIDLGRGNDKLPELVQIYTGLIPADGAGFSGITSITLKNPSCFGNVYATSRFRPLVGGFTVYGLTGACGAGADVGDRSIAVVGTGELLSTGIGGTETRGIEFIRPLRGADPVGAFILQRTPPALVGLNTQTQIPYKVLEVCQGPTNLVQQTDATGRTQLLFVTCFDAGELYVIDPWIPRVVAVTPVGRGPVATVLPPENADPSAPAAQRAYVVGFGANNVAVVDLDPTSRTAFRVIHRIGFPSATPREVGAQ